MFFIAPRRRRHHPYAQWPSPECSCCIANKLISSIIQEIIKFGGTIYGQCYESRTFPLPCLFVLENLYFSQHKPNNNLHFLPGLQIYCKAQGCTTFNKLLTKVERSTSNLVRSAFVLSTFSGSFIFLHLLLFLIRISSAQHYTLPFRQNMLTFGHLSPRR